MSADERQTLEAEAGERTLSDYIRMRLFGPKDRRGPDRRPSFDSRCLAQLLGILGKSNLAPNLESLALAARSGVLEEGPALLRQVEKMRTDLAIIRHELLRGLGVNPG